MPSWAKVLGHRAIRGQQTPGMARRLQPLHAIRTLARGPMRVFTPGIEIPTLPVFDPRPERALGCAITFQLLRHEDPRYVMQPLEPLTQKLLCPLVVAPALDQDIEAVVVLVDSAPQGCAITGYQPVADSGHGAWRLSLLWHFPLDLVLYLRYTTSISLSLLDAARRYHGTPV